MAARRTLRLALALGVLLVACEDDGTGPAGAGPEPARVELSPDSASLHAIGDTIRFAAQVVDPQGDPVEETISVTWTSGDPDVATVDAAGLVTARGEGSASITASADTLTATASVAVVLPVAEISPVSVTLSGPGDTVAFSAQARIPGEGALTGLDFRWSSSDDAVATVEEATGLATARGEGRAVITAESEAYAVSATMVVGAVRAISAGGEDYGHTCSVVAGAVQCWGSGMHGQLGTGSTNVMRGAPVTLSSPTDFESVSVGRLHACGLTTAGDGYCWGVGGPRIGAGETDGAVEPTRVVGGHTFTSVSAGGGHSCGVTPAGKAYCWGGNRHGRLGDGSTDDSAVPVPVSGGHAFVSVSAGVEHACGVTSNGEAYCWGANGGRLGDGTTSGSTVPVAVTGAHTFVSVSAGFNHTCGVTTDGEAYCWGENDFGNLGDGTTTPSTEPVLVTGGHDFASVSAGLWYSCGVTVTGAGYCWGENDYGQLGAGSDAESSAVPLPVAGSHEFAHVDAGSLHTCALTTASERFCWGYRGAGALGDGAHSIHNSPQPVADPPASPFMALDAGGLVTCAVTTADRGYCWGYDVHDQLGDGVSAGEVSTTPTPIAGDLELTEVSVGDFHACALTTARTGFCWGRNANGQVGDGTRTARAVPARIDGGLELAELVAGWEHSCGLTADGSAYCWGSGFGGALGNGAAMDSDRPVPVVGEHTFTELDAGDAFTCALTTDGDAYCWGHNRRGPLGNGTTESSTVPVAVSGGHTFVSLAAGGEFACGIRGDGETYCWGANFDGQLGDGTETASTVPVRVDADVRFASVDGGRRHGCGMTTRGMAYCWGPDFYGRIGTGEDRWFRDVLPPEPVSGGVAFEMTASGGFHTCGLTRSGEAYCWGANFRGQLGIGYPNYETAPVPVASRYGTPAAR